MRTLLLLVAVAALVFADNVYYGMFTSPTGKLSTMVVCLSSNYYLNCRVASTFSPYKTLIFVGNRTYTFTGNDKYQGIHLPLTTGDKELLLANKYNLTEITYTTKTTTLFPTSRYAGSLDAIDNRDYHSLAVVTSPPSNPSARYLYAIFPPGDAIVLRIRSSRSCQTPPIQTCYSFPCLLSSSISSSSNYYIDISTAARDNFFVAAGVLFTSSSNSVGFPESSCWNTWRNNGTVEWLTWTSVVFVVALVVLYFILVVLVKRRRDRGQKVWRIFYLLTCMRPSAPLVDSVPTTPDVMDVHPGTMDVYNVQQQPHLYPQYVTSCNIAPQAQMQVYPQPYFVPSVQPIVPNGDQNVAHYPINGYVAQPHAVENAPQYDPNTRQWL